MASFTDRMIGAAKLDARVYEEVEHDETALGQAMAVVALSSVAAGIGGIGSFGGTGDMGSVLSGGFVFTTILALVGWFVWALIVFIVGTKLLPEAQTKADLAQVLRATGFSAAPGLLRVLGIVPLLGWLVSFVAGLWMLVAMIVAVRQALDYTSTGRAIGVVVIGWIVFMFVSMLATLGAMAGFIGA